MNARSTKLRIVAEMGVLAAVVACDAPTLHLEPPNFNWEEALGPASGNGYVAYQSGTSDTSLAIWTGGDPAAGAYPSDAKVCPPSFVTAFWLYFEGREYPIHGILVKDSDLPPSPLTGLPRAWYLLPPFQEYESTDGTRKIMGGRVSVQCNIIQRRILDSVIYVGRIIAESYDGSSAPTSTFNGMDNGGWAFHKEGVNTNGSGTGSWTDALNAYLIHGTCTPGWKIFVDDLEVCDGT